MLRVPSSRPSKGRGRSLQTPSPYHGSNGAAATGPSPAIALVQTTSLPALVQRELERTILAGELTAGAKLNEAEIATRLGVSRGPVREAFRALEESGLVRQEKNRGVFVRQVSLTEAGDIFELRAVLEAFAGQRVAARATPADIDELATLVSGMERAVARTDAPAYFDGNLAFHDRLVELAGNAKLTQLYRRLVNELKLHRRSSLSRPERLPASAREHRAILDQLREGEGAAAARLLEDHVRASGERAHAGATTLSTLARRPVAPLTAAARRKPRKTAKAA